MLEHRREHDARGEAVIVNDPSLAGTTDLVARIARHGVGVVIRGEPGVGKETLARTLHALSRRPNELVAINCGALTEALLESALFGHERGAVAGATHTKLGLLEIAGGGTILLDEIAEMPLALQGKLLGALEMRQAYRVGGVQPFELRARVIAASRRSLPELVARGAFRDDLYFRLNGITLEVSPLRERRGQIAALARELTTAIFTQEAIDALVQHAWPGNVRELRVVVARAALLAGDAPIDASHLVFEQTVARLEPRTVDFLGVARAHRGNASAIARALHTSRSQVRRLAVRFAIDLDELRRG